MSPPFFNTKWRPCLSVLLDFYWMSLSQLIYWFQIQYDFFLLQSHVLQSFILQLTLSGLFLCMENWVDPSSSSSSCPPRSLLSSQVVRKHQKTDICEAVLTLCGWIYSQVCQQKAVGQVIGYSITAVISCCSFPQPPQNVNTFTDLA